MGSRRRGSRAAGNAALPRRMVRGSRPLHRPGDGIRVRGGRPARVRRRRHRPRGLRPAVRRGRQARIPHRGVGDRGTRRTQRCVRHAPRVPRRRDGARTRGGRAVRPVGCRRPGAAGLDLARGYAGGRERRGSPVRRRIGRRATGGRRSAASILPRWGRRAPAAISGACATARSRDWPSSPTPTGRRLHEHQHPVPRRGRLRHRLPVPRHRRRAPGPRRLRHVPGLARGSRAQPDAVRLRGRRPRRRCS